MDCSSLKLHAKNTSPCMRVILHLCAVLLGHSLPIFVLPPHPLTPFFTGLHALAIRTLGSRVGVVSHLDARFLP